MVLKVIGSGSAGNAYLLENEEEALLIECGVNIKEIKKAINFKISKIKGCLVSHEHKDHAKSINEITETGISVYATAGTFDCFYGTKCNKNAVTIAGGDTFRIGGFRAKAFKINHDAAEPVGYLIHHKDCGNVLFLTDTYYSDYKFLGLNQVIIEANYSEKIIDEKLKDQMFLRDRILKSHMSIETCVKLLEANDLQSVNNIVLIHLSEGNSNEVEFKNIVKNKFNKTTHVATNGMCIDFNLMPY